MKRREIELVGSVVDRTLLSFTHPMIRRVMADRLRDGGPIEVHGWRLGPHRPHSVGLYDTVRIDPDGNLQTRPALRRINQERHHHNDVPKL